MTEKGEQLIEQEREERVNRAEGNSKEREEWHEQGEEESE